MTSPKKSQQLWSTFASAIVLSLAAACGPDDEDVTPIPPPIERAQAFEVVIPINPGAAMQTTDAFGLNPLVLQEGTIVRWVNNDTVDHTVTSVDPGVFDSGLIQPGESFSVPFAVAGVFEYRCLVHPNMRGTIRINAKAP